jgi:hypothetical protein
VRVERLLRRLKVEFIKVNLLQAALDSILVFLGLNLATFFIGLNVMQGVSNTAALAGISSVLFAADLIYRASRYRLELFEKRNPELREALRTARDNLDEDSIVAQSLFEDVLDRARGVKSESIVPSGLIIQKILAVGALSFMTVVSGVADLQLLESTGGAGVLPDITQVTGSGDEESSEDEVEIRNASKIYDDGSEIEVSERLINFSVEGEGETDPSDRQAEQQRRSQDLGFTASPSRLEDDLGLARRYSLEIRG